MTVIDLITKGYFPEELLPPFTSEDLEKVVECVLLDIDSLDPIDGTKRVISKLGTYTTPKIKSYRRNLSIPNPLHYIRLSKSIVENWKEIDEHCEESMISLSRLTMKKDSQRALSHVSFDNIKKERIIRSAGYRFLLKIDITKCYGSIYTHSIPWAIHGKAISKGKRKRKHLFGNALDEDCRRMQDGQTIGIPIGPDSSRIISEIILSSIDVEIKSELKYLSGVRVIDDYHLYFKSQGDLEIARSVINKTLKNYELELNRNKEALCDLPEQIENEWFSAIRDFRFRNSWRHQRSDLIAYFDLVFVYAKRFPEDLVLTYAMSKLQFTIFSSKNWEIFQSLLLNALLFEPKVLPYVAQNFISYSLKGYPLTLETISSALQEFINFQLPLNNDFEIAWSLWILRALKIQLHESTAKGLSEYLNPVVILTILDMHGMGLIPKGLTFKNWKGMLSQENLYSEYWLVAYEAKMKGWLTSTVDYISKDPFFKILKENGVSFYNPERELDLSKVKVHTTDFYVDPSNKDDPEHEQSSVFSSAVSTKDEANSPNRNPQDDLPF